MVPRWVNLGWQWLNLGRRRIRLGQQRLNFGWRWLNIDLWRPRINLSWCWLNLGLAHRLYQEKTQRQSYFHLDISASVFKILLLAVEHDPWISQILSYRSPNQRRCELLDMMWSLAPYQQWPDTEAEMKQQQHNGALDLTWYRISAIHGWYGKADYCFITTLCAWSKAADPAADCPIALREIRPAFKTS